MSSDISLFNSDTEVTDKLSDCDIIDETPQKIFKKRGNNRSKNKKEFGKGVKIPLLNLDDRKQSSLRIESEYRVVRNSNTTLIKIPIGDLNGKYKNPHVFYDIKDLSHFNDRCTPANVNMKLFGLYRQRSTCNYLLEFKKISLKVNPLKVLLNLDLVNYFPVCGQNIEVYGFLRHQNVGDKTRLVFVVKFWKNISWEFKRYLDTLRSQKLLVPCCYTTVVNNSSNFNLTEVGKCIAESQADFSFEEIDEVFLYKNVEYIEHIAREFEQMMNINEDIFK